MSHDLVLAQSHAWNLARTLMIPMTLFQVDDTFGVMPTEDLDGAALEVICEYAPHEPEH